MQLDDFEKLSADFQRPKKEKKKKEKAKANTYFPNRQVLMAQCLQYIQPEDLYEVLDQSNSSN